jgi:Acetyltransferase (GNAT) domain
MSHNSNTTEVRVKGRWVAVPSLDINGQTLYATGTWLRTAKVRGEEMMEDELSNPCAYIEELKGKGSHTLRADIFTFTQKLPATHPKCPYPFDWESVAAIHLVNFDQWWTSLPQETRKNVRRSAKRGAVVKTSEFNDQLIQGIRGVNDDSPLRQGMPNAYYGRSFDETKKLYGEFAGRCDFVCAYYGNELIGFLHLVYRRGVAAILNLTTKPSHFDKRPANSLMAEAVRICAAKGISHITYGLYNYGNKRDNPLREFKIRCGFTEVLVPRYFVPLTLWGGICVKTKLHRGAVGILPHSAIMAAVRVRSLWYKSAAHLSRCSSMSERPNRTRQMERSNPPAGSTT